MKTPTVMLAALTAFAAFSAFAQSAPLSYTDAAPYTDITVPTRTAGGAPSYWKGQLTREDVLAALRQARVERTIATGDAIGYPYPTRMPDADVQAAQRASGQALGGPPGDGLTVDGYRFVGGEMGYMYVGRPSPAR